jgi:ABC-2 type transport system ATP-binding protein
MAEAEGVALRLDGLSRRFRTRWALRDCSLELPRGRVSALVGPNGAGKTTLFMLATGLLRPTSGTIDVLGADPARTGMPAGASFLAQDKPLYRTFRVAEVLRAAAVLNSRARWDAGYAARLVDEAGIGPEERVRELSSGQRARVALAVALGRRPELLLLDEPLSELDPLARRQVMGTVLAEVTATGMTVLMSSHVLSDIDDTCDHLVLLRHGRVRLAGAIDDLLAGHRHLTGPATNRDDLVGATAVHTSTVGRQTIALVRGTEAPPAFRAERPTLDDLVLAYLQAPESAA